ncbi:MAG: XRE family transcriptional regulator [Lachnospiraceae bacterium]|nr:MAG: XRE family transcriptional regulator [Lachnospiraceae bacterium]
MQINEAKLAYYLTLKEKTQSQLAELTGVSRNTIYSIKKGRRCSDEVGNKIAKALGVDIAELIEKR